MTAVILQARLDSSRLPAKALLDLQGKTVLRRAMEALKAIPSAEAFFLATDPDSAPNLAPQAEAEGFRLFAGSKENVLNRFAELIRAEGIDRIIRATGDNPLVSPELAEETLAYQAEEAADYAGLVGAPLGTGVEVVRAEALLEADRKAEDSYEREHVCPYLYRRPAKFTIRRRQVPDEFFYPAGRVTLDTLEDYRYIARIFDELYSGGPIRIGELVGWLKSRPARGEKSDEQDPGYPVGKTG